VSGPSGAGKGTLVAGLLERVPEMWISVSATTRIVRPGESDGVHYVFLSGEEFEQRVRHNEFLEHAIVHGNRYGTLRGPVEDVVSQGRDVVLEIDVQGALQVKDAMPEAVLVFIVAPSMQELRRRIEHRGAEEKEEVEVRMHTAERELKLVDTYDYVVINDDVIRATDELVGIVRSFSETKD